jgi:hypothetical protein
MYPLQMCEDKKIFTEGETCVREYVVALLKVELAGRQAELQIKGILDKIF